jgi:Uma2 family endonuclease
MTDLASLLPSINPKDGVASFVSGRLFKRLDDWCNVSKLGAAITGCPTFRLDLVRSQMMLQADCCVLECGEELVSVAFKSIERAPLIAILVISGTDKANATHATIDLFLNKGTGLVWVIHPKLRITFVHRADGTVTKLREPAELTGENVMPGFSVQLSDFLPPVPAK